MNEYIDYIGLFVGCILGIIGNYWGHYLIHQNEYIDDFLGISIVILLFGLVLTPLFGLESLLAFILSLVGTVATTIKIQNAPNIGISKLFWVCCAVLFLLLIFGIVYQIKLAPTLLPNSL